MHTRTLLALALVVLAGSLLGCGGQDGLRHSRTSSPGARGALPSRLERVEPIRTERIASGEIKLAETGSLKLEATLQDLNRRKDHDAAAHGGQAGPDSAYLHEWVEKITQELLSRGYYVDDAGVLHRPGVAVPWR